ncbi:NAD(P)-binding protein [Hypoxylon sp. NC0597]|nr:NAD(P)-binding protein [Hypoxylon sp. NC0597]
MDLTGYALVFGGGSGISRATSMIFAKYGARGLMVADINLESATKVANESKAVATHPNFRAEAVQVDVTVPDSVQHATEATVRAFGRIDYCVNGAGVVGETSDLIDHNTDQFQRVMDVNVRGSFLAMKAVSAVMASQEPFLIDPDNPVRGISRGSIVNIGSVASFVALPQAIGYITSKHAVLGLTRTAALDNIKHNIRVNCVCPSWVDTPMIEELLARVPPFKEIIRAQLPMGRMALPEEVADVIAFLCSPKSSWVNGSNFTVDGAMTLCPSCPIPPEVSAGNI